MPHLSPMNWIAMITLSWIILLTISASFWWSQSNTFYSPSNSNKSSSMKYMWKWQL